MPHKGHLKGTRILPRDIAALAHRHGWRDLDLVVAVAVSLAESAGYDHAYCDNFEDPQLKHLLSRDVGLWQINIPKSEIGTPKEKHLYGHEGNAAAARTLYLARGWEPWHAYTSGIALGPQYAGKYIQRAISGAADFYAGHFGVPVPLVHA